MAPVFPPELLHYELLFQADERTFMEKLSMGPGHRCEGPEKKTQTNLEKLKKHGNLF